MRAAVVATGAQNGRASLHWQQREGQFAITVSGPFGTGATRIEGNLTQVQVTRGNEQYLSQSPEADLARVMGAPVPLEQMISWVRGLAVDGSPITGSQTRSGVWQVSIEEQQTVDGCLLPAQLQIDGPGQSLGLRRMRWELSP